MFSRGRSQTTLARVVEIENVNVMQIFSLITLNEFLHRCQQGKGPLIRLGVDQKKKSEFEEALFYTFLE